MCKKNHTKREKRKKFEQRKEIENKNIDDDLCKKKWKNKTKVKKRSFIKDRCLT